MGRQEHLGQNHTSVAAGTDAAKGLLAYGLGRGAARIGLSCAIFLGRHDHHIGPANEEGDR